MKNKEDSERRQKKKNLQRNKAGKRENFKSIIFLRTEQIEYVSIVFASSIFCWDMAFMPFREEMGII
jgi:hypothetical protein